MTPYFKINKMYIMLTFPLICYNNYECYLTSFYIVVKNIGFILIKTVVFSDFFIGAGFKFL